MEKIWARNFVFSYKNVLTSDLIQLKSELLKSVKVYLICGYCFSLSSENVLTAYIKTKKQIVFKPVRAKILISKKFGHPEDLSSVLVPKDLIYNLFVNDVNKGKYFSQLFLDTALEMQKTAGQKKTYKQVQARSFSFSYKNVLTSDLIELKSELLKRLENYLVVQYCFSLSLEKVLTIYIKTEKKIKFKCQYPKILISKKFGNPENLKSIIDIKTFARILYVNDINKGEYFNLYKYIRSAIGFVEKIKPIAFERVVGNDFVVSYENVSDANLRVIYMILLKRLNGLIKNEEFPNVRGFCCSLDTSNTLTIYFRTRQKVDFMETKPEILVINRLSCFPTNIKLVTNSYEIISVLYKNDVYEGHYFTSSLLIEIAIWREFLPKSKRLQDAIIPDVEDYEDYEPISNL